MSTVQEEIKALKAKIERYEAEYDATTDPAMKGSLLDVIAATRADITELRKQAAPASSSTAATEARGKHLSPSL